MVTGDEAVYQSDEDEDWTPKVSWTGSFKQMVMVNDHVGVRINVEDGVCVRVDLGVYDGTGWRLPESSEEVMHVAADFGLFVASQYSTVPVKPGTFVCTIEPSPEHIYGDISLS